ncbi:MULTISPECIES: hypothetical protein [Moorena]|uniref:hypothetical protein n=1 Tax=Moorena TaxID=1155738 RepID=UPI0003111681|nr:MULTISPECIES: hypothetical protein [Moorena]NEP33736.1 hypothetical protein [Moorena sp. SIO3B2]NEP64227.1 hypothetical protein [Moorena sp. SIO3A5]
MPDPCRLYSKIAQNQNRLLASLVNCQHDCKHSAVSGQRSAVSGQRSVVSGQPSAVS